MSDHSEGAARVVAVIPARGGSKGVPGKNYAPVGGIPLIVRAVSAARAALAIDRVYVSTDDATIASFATQAGADIISRPAAISGDLASSESALLHALDAIDEPVDVLVFLQATSPFIDSAAIDRAVRRVLSNEVDVVFSGFETYAFLWRLNDNNQAEGVNHDASYRPRRQDREAHIQETGAFYVMRAQQFREAGHRFFGRIGIELTDERSAIEIDSADQLQLAHAIAGIADLPSEIDVDAVVTDFDGVHTDDTVSIALAGDERVTVSRSDGLGVRLLREAGVRVLILSTEKHPIVAARADKLQVEVLHGIDDKAAALSQWAASNDIPLSRIAYVGNDINDLGCLAAVGWPIAVRGSHESVLSAARVVLSKRGGHGAVRELAERVLRARTRERNDS